MSTVLSVLFPFWLNLHIHQSLVPLERLNKTLEKDCWHLYISEDYQRLLCSQLSFINLLVSFYEFHFLKHNAYMTFSTIYYISEVTSILAITVTTNIFSTSLMENPLTCVSPLKQTSWIYAYFFGKFFLY